MPKRGITADSDCMVLEFLASQTLLEVHNTILQMAEDDLLKMATRAPDKDGNNDEETSTITDDMIIPVTSLWKIHSIPQDWSIVWVPFWIGLMVVDHPTQHGAAT